MDLYSAENMAKALMEKHDLISKGWVFGWANSRRSFGVASTSKRTGKLVKDIKLSKVLTSLNDEKEVKETILHEIAHALDYEIHGHWRRSNGRRLTHDSIWRKIYISIGGNGKATYNAKHIVTPKREFKFVMFDRTSQAIVKKYYKRPSRNVIINIDEFQVKGRPETAGSLCIMRINSDGSLSEI